MFSLDESRYHAHLLETGGIALVLFTSPSCGTCRVVERRLPLAAPAGTHLFAVDVQQATGLARAFDIFHLPTLLLYRDGHFHARLDCEISAAALRAALAQALAAPPEEEP
jgi:thioredoxin 1